MWKQERERSGKSEENRHPHAVAILMSLEAQQYELPSGHTQTSQATQNGQEL